MTLTVVVEQLLYKVDVGEHHSSTAVSLEPELIQSVALVKVGLQQAEVRFPLVPDHFPASEASHWDDHGCRTLWQCSSPSASQCGAAQRGADKIGETWMHS